MKQADAWVDGSYNVHNGLAGYGVYLRIDGTARVASGDEARALTHAFRKKLGDSPKLPGASVYAVDRAK